MNINSIGYTQKILPKTDNSKVASNSVSFEGEKKKTNKNALMGALMLTAAINAATLASCRLPVTPQMNEVSTIYDIPGMATAGMETKKAENNFLIVPDDFLNDESEVPSFTLVAGSEYKENKEMYDAKALDEGAVTSFVAFNNRSKDYNNKFVIVPDKTIESRMESEIKWGFSEPHYCVTRDEKFLELALEPVESIDENGHKVFSVELFGEGEDGFASVDYHPHENKKVYSKNNGETATYPILAIPDNYAISESYNDEDSYKMHGIVQEGRIMTLDSFVETCIDPLETMSVKE